VAVKLCEVHRKNIGQKISFDPQSPNDALIFATPAEIAELIGHEQGFTFSVYAPMQLPMKALKELIERIHYPGLRLKHLYIK